MSEKFKIVLIDYGMGNLRSIRNALNHIGDFEIIVTADGQLIETADCLILPGVGAYPDAVKNLQDTGLVSLLNRLVQDEKKPLLGICLGMQLLFESSAEGGESNPGLGWIPGQIKYMEPGEGYRVPHVGWNSLILKQDSVMFEQLGADKDFYFVHSLHAECDPRYLLATFEYGQEFTAAVQNDNVVGMQFHPEKSQKNGLAALSQFVNWAQERVNA